MKVLSAIVLISFNPLGLGFEWSTGGRPDITRHEIAGLWKLTRPSPLKEFTVRPRKPSPQPLELLLMLKEDGSFQQYKTETEDTTPDIDQAWNKFQESLSTATQRDGIQQQSESLQQSFLKGTWDYVDGNLLLAADRPAPAPVEYSRKYGQQRETSVTQQQEKRDTLLVGQVVATYETSLSENPALKKNDTETAGDQINQQKQRSSSVQLDARLSVPLGSVEVGKFMYPKRHPSFFETPIFRPQKLGLFSLKQVLGSLNARQKAKEDELVEKYRCSHFHNKTFLVTSHPLQHEYKGKKRWSIKYNKFVYDKKDAIKKEEEEAAQRMVNIRVMQVHFFANNTFRTVAGLGDDVILRGKYDIIGRERDQLWMQVWRFGFGRSVSGSVYSEGKHLTHDDAKTYWGNIDVEPSLRPKNNTISNVDGNEIKGNLQSDTSQSNDSEEQRIEVKGSVFVGWGLEPQPVSSFIMRELREDDRTIDEDEDEIDDDEAEEETQITFNVQDIQDDGIDLSDEDNNAFQ
jgi:hypothetical protein